MQHQRRGTGRRVRIGVRDTRDGIAPEQVARVFDGGLAIGRDPAWRVGGELTEASTPALDSVFTPELPAVGGG